MRRHCGYFQLSLGGSGGCSDQAASLRLTDKLIHRWPIERSGGTVKGGAVRLKHGYVRTPVCPPGMQVFGVCCRLAGISDRMQVNYRSRLPSAQKSIASEAEKPAPTVLPGKIEPDVSSSVATVIWTPVLVRA
jgi:hypothetical protein